MASPLILARTFQDAHRYASEELGLSNGYYRVVTSPGTIKAVRGVDIHLVPGWDKRPDRFTMKGALRYCRLNVIDVEKVRESATAFDAAMPPATVPEPEAAQESEVEPDSIEVPDEPKPEPVVNPEDLMTGPEQMAARSLLENLDSDPPKARRRTRCKDCEQLHYKGDPCIESEDS